MAYVFTGYKRSLSVEVTKTINGVPQAGYPKTYPTATDIANGYFTYNSVQYPIPPNGMAEQDFAQLEPVQYNNLLNVFKLYVMSQEPNINFNTQAVNSPEVYDIDSCPVGTPVEDVYSFNVMYGNLPVDACNGTITTVYSNKSNPTIGDFIYKDSALTQAWNTPQGSSMLFINPDIHNNHVIGVAIVEVPNEYSVGEIMIVTDTICNEATLPEQTTAETTEEQTTEETTEQTTESPYPKLIPCGDYGVDFNNYRPGGQNEWEAGVYLGEPAPKKYKFDIYFEATRNDTSGSHSDTISVIVAQGNMSGISSSTAGLSQDNQEDWTVTEYSVVGITVNDIEADDGNYEFAPNCPE